MAYKINIRNTGNTGWVNLLESQYHVVADAAGYFAGATVETVLAELFTTKARRVEDIVAPTVSENLETGTVWVDTVANTVYVCVDATSNANIWLNLSSLNTEGIEDIAGGLITRGTKENITATYNDANDRIDLSVATATDSVLGVASFDSANFAVTAGHVTIKAGGVTVTELASNINATSIGFDADKVDGRDVDDAAAVSTNTLWTSAKVKNYVDSLAAGISWQEPVLDKDLDDPPASPATGDRYIISAGLPLATGAWTGHDNSIATWNGAAWVFEPVVEGMASWVTDEDVVFVYNGTVWAKIGTTITHSNLIGLQGGNGGTELYHFTDAEHTALVGSKAANTVFAAPDGTTGVGGFRVLVQADIPNLAASKITDFTEAAQDAVGAAITAGTFTRMSLSYDDGTDTINGSVPLSSITTTGSNLAPGGGTFDTTDGWNMAGGFSNISGGVLNLIAASSSSINTTTSPFTIGKPYTMTFTITNYVSGTLTAWIGNSSLDINANGTYTIIGVAANTNLYLGMSGSSTSMDLDNLTILEISETVGVSSFDSTYFTITDGHVSLSPSSISHDDLKNLKSSDDHTQYVHNTIARTIVARHTFNPASAQAPFTLGANAQGQLVTGFNADLLNGQDWTVAATAQAPATPQTNDIWIEITA